MHFGVTPQDDCGLPLKIYRLEDEGEPATLNLQAAMHPWTLDSFTYQHSRQVSDHSHLADIMKLPMRVPNNRHCRPRTLWLHLFFKKAF